MDLDRADRQRAVARRASLGGALLAAVIALLGGLGWIVDVAWLKSFGVGAAAMSPLTAIAILIASAGAAALQRGARRAARLGGVVVAALGVVALLEWVLGVPGGVAQHLVREAQRGPLTGRVSVPAASIFVSIGLALILRGRTRARVWSSDALALVSAFGAFTVLTAYAYGATSFAPMLGAPETGMAMPTSIALFALSFAILLAEADVGVASIVASDVPGASLARRAIVLVLFGPPLLGVLLRLGPRVGWLDVLAQIALVTVLTSSIAVVAALLSVRRLLSSEERRREAEAQVHAAEALYRGLVAQAPDAILGVQDGVVVLANARAAAMFGRSEEALRGAAIEDLVPGMSRGGCAVGPVELEARGAAGSTTVEATCSVAFDGARRMTAILRDVSERRRAELEMRRLAAIVESSTDAIVATDARGTIVAWNQAAERLYGWAAVEAIGRDLRMTFPPEVAAAGEDVMRRLRRGERVEPYDTVRLRKDGSRFAAAVTVSAITDPAGRVVGFSGIARDVSERKRMEDALRANEARFRTLFQFASDGVFFADLDGRYTDVNEAGCRMLRRTRDDVVGKTIVELIRPEQAAQLFADRDAVVAGATLVSEYDMRRGDGTWATIEVSTRMLPDGRWVGLTRDVSERRAAEDALRRAHETERRLRRQIEAISDATTAVSDAVARLPHSDVVTVMQTVVLQAQAITGARYGALGIGTDPDRPFDPWVAQGMPEEAVRAIGRTPRPRGLLGAVAREGRTICVDEVDAEPGFGGFPPGHPPMHTLLGVPIRYQDTPVGNLYLSEKADGAPFDAEDLRAIQILADRVAIALETARLYESEARERSWLQVTIDQMPEPVLLADAQGRVTSWNRAAQRFVREGAPHAARGVPFDLRRPNGDVLPWDDHPVALACARGTLVASIELLAIAHDGARVPVLASASPLAIDGVATRGAVVILRDIGPIKELQRLREEWTAVVAHDLRQPVSSIALSAQMLQRRRGAALSSDEAGLISRIQGGAVRLRRMIDDLLDYAQIEAGHLRLVPRQVDMVQLLTETVERIAETTPGHAVRLEIHDGAASAEVDAGRIEQVIANLVTNAAKYGDPRTDILVELGVRPGEVEIAVTNSGRGLTDDEIGQMFERFYRTPSALGSTTQGLGLGLFITKGIVDAHGGRIHVESTPGQTTTFRVLLPAERHSQAA